MLRVHYNTETYLVDPNFQLYIILQNIHHEATHKILERCIYLGIAAVMQDPDSSPIHDPFYTANDETVCVHLPSESCGSLITLPFYRKY